MAEVKKIAGAITSARYRNFKIAGAVGVLAYSYYRYWRRNMIKHDASIAQEFCPNEVRAFKMCHPDQIITCKHELYDLHSCIVLQKESANQFNINNF